MIRICRICKKSYEHTGNRRDFQCPPCWKAYKNAWKAKRQAQGFLSDAYYWDKEKRKEWENRPEQKIKRAANRKIQGLIASGKIKRQPCEKCGKPKAHAHHDDYSKPLVVRWLCPQHHTEHHREGRA